MNLSPPKPPIMAGYFRTWRDSAHDPSTNPISMIDLPEGMDIAIVFPWDTPPESPFWGALKTSYVPALHAKGIKVVITQGIETLLDDKYPDTPEGHEAYVNYVMDTYITPFNLDGLDIDYEQHLSPKELNKTIAIFKRLSARLGPQSGTKRLLIIDTNREGNDPLFTPIASMIDYIFLQAYGRSLASIPDTFESFKPVIPAHKFVLGFSFYEESGTRWNDVSEDGNSGRAFDYARWQPATGEAKGGVFSYAIDRDIPRQTDEIIAADFAVTARLMEIMNS